MPRSHSGRALVWFRGKNLRLADHQPLRAALDGGEVVPLFVLDPYFFAPARARDLPDRMQHAAARSRFLAVAKAHLRRGGGP